MITQPNQHINLTQNSALLFDFLVLFSKLFCRFKFSVINVLGRLYANPLCAKHNMNNLLNLFGQTTKFTIKTRL